MTGPDPTGARSKVTAARVGLGAAVAAAIAAGVLLMPHTPPAPLCAQGRIGLVMPADVLPTSASSGDTIYVATRDTTIVLTDATHIGVKLDSGQSRQLGVGCYLADSAYVMRLVTTMPGGTSQ